MLDLAPLQPLCVRRHSIGADLLHRSRHRQRAVMGRRPFRSALAAVVAGGLGSDAAGRHPRRADDPLAVTSNDARLVGRERQPPE